jgi:hypothetical protein
VLVQQQERQVQLQRQEQQVQLQRQEQQEQQQALLFYRKRPKQQPTKLPRGVIFSWRFLSDVFEKFRGLPHVLA